MPFDDAPEMERVEAKLTTSSDENRIIDRPYIIWYKLDKCFANMGEILGSRAR